MTFANQTLLQRLNDHGLWRNPLRIPILSSALGISSIALKHRMNYRRIIRGPYVIDDREHMRILASQRSRIVKSYAALTGDPRSKVRRIAKKFGITERQVRAKLEVCLDHADRGNWWATRIAGCHSRCRRARRDPSTYVPPLLISVTQPGHELLLQ